MRPEDGPGRTEPERRILVFLIVKFETGLQGQSETHAIDEDKEPMLPMNSPSAFITVWC
jgi:hypothetical protein